MTARTARIMTGKNGNQTQGFTFVELLVALSVAAVGFAAFLGIALQAVKDYAFFTAESLVDQWNQQIVNDIRDDTLASKQYFQNDAVGQGYYAALALPPSVPALNPTRLPLIDETGDFEKDTPGLEKTGNALFFAKMETPFVATIQMDDSTNATFRINVYRLVLYYLSLRPGDTVGGSTCTLDLVRWMSLPFADYGQMMAVQDPDPGDLIDPRAQLVAAFVNQTGGTFLWDGTKGVDQAFFECDGSGWVSGVPEPNMVIPRDPNEGLRSMIPGGMRAGKRISVGMNAGTPGFIGGPPVPVYGILDPTGDGFPHGFEVQLVGPSGARKLMVRLVLVKEGADQLVGREFKAVLTTRDF